LRMKRRPVRILPLHCGTCFQFLWGWNKRFSKPHLTMLTYTFNSFEDETQKGRAVYIYPNTLDFQFLWGWNYEASPLLGAGSLSFNSFEDETQYRELPDVGDTIVFQFLWGWNLVICNRWCICTN